MLDKWTRKYMKLAKALADDNNACYSRRIGCILVSNLNRVIGTGYNGAAEGVPHADSYEYLSHLYDDLVTNEERDLLLEKFKADSRTKFLENAVGCKQCPRRMLNIPSGEKLEYCSCSHSERNAILSCAKSGVSCEGGTLYCFCGCCCHECTIAIIQAGIKKVVCLKTNLPDYSKSSRWLFKNANVELIEVDEKEIFAE